MTRTLRTARANAWAVFNSWITSTLVRETSEQESMNRGYRFGQKEPSHNIVAAHAYLGRLVMPYAATDNSRSVHLLLVVWPVVGIWCSALAVVSFAFNLNGFNFNHSLLDGQGRPIASWADLLNRADLGIEAMHVRHDPNVPLDLSIPA